MTTYDRDLTDADGNVTHKRGEIETVTKTYDGKTTALDQRRWRRDPHLVRPER